MAIAPFKIDERTKAALKIAGADLSTHIITFLTLNWEPRYVSLKLTQCQNILLKNVVDRSKLFLQMVIREAFI